MSSDGSNQLGADGARTDKVVIPQFFDAQQEAI